MTPHPSLVTVELRAAKKVHLEAAIVQRRAINQLVKSVKADVAQNRLCCLYPTPREYSQFLHPPACKYDTKTLFHENVIGYKKAIMITHCIKSIKSDAGRHPSLVRGLTTAVEASLGWS